MVRVVFLIRSFRRRPYNLRMIAVDYHVAFTMRFYNFYNVARNNISRKECRLFTMSNDDTLSQRTESYRVVRPTSVYFMPVPNRWRSTLYCIKLQQNTLLGVVCLFVSS